MPLISLHLNVCCGRSDDQNEVRSKVNLVSLLTTKLNSTGRYLSDDKKCNRTNRQCNNPIQFISIYVKTIKVLSVQLEIGYFISKSKLNFNLTANLQHISYNVLRYTCLQVTSCLVCNMLYRNK